MTEAVKRENLLTVNDLKTYFPTDEGVVKAVDGISFKIDEGATLGVVGESGCGKSTVGRSILQILDKPGGVEDGEILWRTDSLDGTSMVVDVARQRPNSKTMRSIRGQDIALIFQEPMTSFSPVHTIGNQMMEMIRLHRDVSKAEAKDRSIELLQSVGIPNPAQRVDEYSFQLSGGLRQRAMIAMALSCDPKLLIADEPTTALDVTTQAQILDLLRQLQEQNGMAIMLITHNLGVIAEMADDIVVMYLGRAVESGPVDEVFHNPQHPYTRGLLRSIPSIYGSDIKRLPSITGTIPHPFNRPAGCTFSPRCPDFIEGTCDSNEPAFKSMDGTSQMVSCFLHHPPQGVEVTATEEGTSD
ncbi:MAG: ABC transporter ATP-binding protein [SAR202 cluster bacterium]|jgi:peptide/nickel transport system ATP-binding protein|nr:ABC transporter ATP-binding protein [SAR202 cluster bacterium]